MQISPTLPRTSDSTLEISASRVCSWLQPGLFSNKPFLALMISRSHAAYASSTILSFFDDRTGPGMTSLIPREKP